MAKKAKIQKLKEDTIFSNGSDKTVFPVTVGDAVIAEYANQQTTLQPALDTIYSTKCGWFTTRLDEDGKYHLLGFPSKRIYDAWNGSTDPNKDKLYVIIDVVTGEHYIDPEDPTPDTPIPDEEPTVISPISYDLDPEHTVYSSSNSFILKGRNLSKWITIENYNPEHDPLKQNFYFKAVGHDDYPKVVTVLKTTKVTQEVCSNNGIEVQITLNPVAMENNYNSVVNGDIRIYNDVVEGEPKEFEDIIIKGSCSNFPKYAFPDNNNEPPTIQLRNEEGSDIKSFKIQGINTSGNTTISTAGNSGIYLSYGKHIDTSANNTTITINEETINKGVTVFVTCNRYVDNIVDSVPTSSYLSTITISNTPNSEAYVTLPLQYTYAEPAVPKLYLSDTILTLDYQDVDLHDPCYTFSVWGENLTEDAVIRAQYPPASENSRPVRFQLYRAKGGVDDIIWEPAGTNQDLTISATSLNVSTENAPTLVKLAFDPNNFDNVEPFTTGICNVICGDFDYDIRLQYTRDSSQEPIDYAIKRSSNPVFVDAILRLLKERYKVESPDGNLTEDMCALIEELPDNFMKNTGQNHTIDVTRRFMSLTELGLFPNLKKIGNEAFANCADLATVIIPSTITQIGESCFEGCKSLHTVTFQDTLDNPAQITKIPKRAFYGCTALESITIPRSVLEIFDYAFANSGIESFIFNGEENEYFRTIGNYAFDSCHNLTTIDIHPKYAVTVKNIFDNCENITDIYFRSNTIASIFVFPGQTLQMFVPGSTITLHVPANKVSNYQNSAWTQIPNVTINVVAIDE